MNLMSRKSAFRCLFVLACLAFWSMTSAQADEKAASKRAPPRASLEFSGEEYVLIPKLRYDGSHPITLEAIVTPQLQDPASPRSAVVANLQLAGVGLHMSGGRWMFHVNEGRNTNAGYASAYAEQSADLDKTVHLACVYDGRNVRLFVDGKLQGNVAETTLKHVPSPYDFMIGADPGGKGEPHQFFKGTIDEVHISKVARYTKDSTPARKSKPDEYTWVLYHLDENKGTVARDAPKNEHHAEIHGAKWVKEKKLGE